jgi:hypothetical protein
MSPVRALWLLLPGLLLLAAAEPASALLSQSSTSVAGARFVGDDDLGIGGPGAGGIGFTTQVGSFAMDFQELGPTYEGDFEWEASFTGNGFVDYGYGEVELNAIATATPAEIESVPPGNPAFNGQFSSFDGNVSVSFSEVGVVTGPAPGTPVALEVTVDSDGEALISGGNFGRDRNANTGTDVDVIDNSNGFVGIELFFFGPDTRTQTLNTFVGNQIAVSGTFRVFAECFAGTPLPFVETCSAQGASQSTVVFGLPAGFGFDAPSGHDYTVTVPEPGQALLALVGALALAARRYAGNG